MAVYSPLKEDETDKKGWEKSTLGYIEANKSKVERMIKEIAKKLNYKLQNLEVGDVFNNLAQYLYDTDDYSIEKAMENCEKNGSAIITLEGFVAKSVENCLRRYVSKRGRHEKNTISTFIYDSDGNETSTFDYIPDIKAEERIYKTSEEEDLDTICSLNEYRRYAFGAGIDIFLVLYIKIFALNINKNGIADEIISIMGENKRNVENLNNRKDDSLATELAKAVSRLELSSALKIIRKYIYGADAIDKTIETYANYYSGSDIQSA